MQRFEKREIKINDKPNQIEFMSPDPVFESMRSELEKVAQRIKKAVNDKQRIVVKHHNDVDGFCAGIALDRAIVPLISITNTKRLATKEKFKRMPSHTPFYNIEDATKDVAQFLTLESQFQEVPPLVIIADMGSGPENITPIKFLKAIGCEVIVLDHHPIDERVPPLCDYHINFLQYGEEPYSAGVLCAELSRMINFKATNYANIAAISCVGDRVDEEKAKPYISQADANKEELIELAKAIDFSAFNLRNLDAKELVNVLFGDDKDRQQKIMHILSAEVSEKSERAVSQALSLVRIEHTAKVSYALLAVEDMAMRDPYPRLGILAGLVHDRVEYKNPGIFLAYTSNSITFRADTTLFNFQHLLPKLLALPKAFVDGGGHPQAGTVRFSPKAFDQVMTAVKEYLHSL